MDAKGRDGKNREGRKCLDQPASLGNLRENRRDKKKEKGSENNRANWK
jgi:hypothetical protein